MVKVAPGKSIVVKVSLADVLADAPAPLIDAAASTNAPPVINNARHAIALPMIRPSFLPQGGVFDDHETPSSARQSPAHPCRRTGVTFMIPAAAAMVAW